MRIILFSTQHFHHRHELVKDLLMQLHGISLEAVDSIHCLTKKLRQPLNRISVIVFYARTVEEIESLSGLIRLFDDIRLILVLPDRQDQTLSLGIKLKPSFISYNDNDNVDIVNVLRHIQRQK